MYMHTKVKNAVEQQKKKKPDMTPCVCTPAGRVPFINQDLYSKAPAMQAERTDLAKM